MRGQPAIYPIILAAGPSSLGVPKALARFGDRTALEIALGNCRGLETPTVVLGAGAAVIRPHVPKEARSVVNRRWRSGQISSLLLALRSLPRGADILLYPVDYPLVTREMVAALVRAFGNRAAGFDIAVPTHRGRTGHPIVIAGKLAGELRRAKTAREVVYRLPERLLKVEVNSDAIWRDLDSQAGYRHARKEYGKRGQRAAHKDEVGSLLDETRSGLPLTPSLALKLINCADCDLPALLAAARAVRDQVKPGVITYSRKVFLPLTNLCRDYCGYCIFRRDPGQPGAHTMTPDEVLRVAHEGERLGCREALFSLGDKPEQMFPEMRATLRRLGYRSTLHYLEAMCELVLRETALIPHANPGLMSSAWLRRLRVVSPSLGLMLESTSRKLLRRGAAHDRAPDKPPELRLKTIAEAGKQAIPFTTGILVGIGETARDRVDSLFAILELHRRYGHIQEVIIQNFRVKPAIPMAEWPEPSRGEMLRTIAVARLILRDMNIQAPPNLSAPDYEELLSAGINDWGGISPLTPDFINPERPWPHLEELQRRTEAAGYQLKQRLPVYPEFLAMVKAAGGLGAEKLVVVIMDKGENGPGCFARPAEAQSQSSPTAVRSAS